MKGGLIGLDAVNDPEKLDLEAKTLARKIQDLSSIGKYPALNGSVFLLTIATILFIFQ